MAAVAENAGTRRDEILTSSADLFRRKGFREASIRDIASALDIKSASLYYHFENKEEILFAIAYGLMSDFVAEVTPLLRRPGQPGELIAATVAAHLRFDIENVDRVIVSSRERRALPEERQRPINALRRRHRRELERVVAAGVANGEFLVADPKVATTALLDLLAGVKEWYRPGGRAKLAELIANYQAFAAALLRAGA